MKTYVILSRFSPDAFTNPQDFRNIAMDVSNRIREQCPGVIWIVGNEDECVVLMRQC